MHVSPQEQVLCKQLRELPRSFRHRYTKEASQQLLQILFRSLAGHSDDTLHYFFPQGPPASTERWSLRTAQGAVDGAEYTEAAKGHPCGHIFKSGEATYRCKTCTVDDTCVLCAKCFDASDHEGHTVYVIISPGNSGCCDCGDPEAWIRPVHCNIHSLAENVEHGTTGKAREGSVLPVEIQSSIRTTISRALDYVIDVFSCSPEQLRLPKTEHMIRQDEAKSRLTSRWYGGADEEEENQEFSLVLWNDEKHTVYDVRDQVNRACKARQSFGLEKAYEVDDVGRSVIIYHSDIKELLRMAKVIEDIKLTVTIRSARDTFREQMCGTIIEWISDIAGCSVGPDHQILRNTICEEMLKVWRVGSDAHHQQIGRDGLDDHEIEDREDEHSMFSIARRRAPGRTQRASEEEEEDWDDDEQGEDADADEDDDMDVDSYLAEEGEGDVDMDASDEPEDELEASEATLAGYPPPPPPPPPRRRDHDHTPADSDGESAPLLHAAFVESVLEVPKTPKVRPKSLRPPRPSKFWLERPEGYSQRGTQPVHEDLWQRVRLDYLILYDLRMWKRMRINLRDVLISTVVTIPQFKRILGLRFAGLYTALAQLYLIADREPDHSIINLSLQMLTTPSITAEVVERGNFLTTLLAILYTFLTTRQVGYPWDVNPQASLAFEAGAVANRRMFHFFMDVKFLLGSEHIKEKLCEEERYLLQFLDLVKLHQGICPNIRAVGEHLEYETDAWISASIVTREINKLCRQFSEAFTWRRDQDETNISRAIRRTAKAVIINSVGAERKRFTQAEIKTPVRFKSMMPFEFDVGALETHVYRIVDFTVAKEPMSFHHALHYTLSWFIDRGKSMSRDQLLRLLIFSVHELREPPAPSKVAVPELQPEEYLLALFDYPLRVCSWLAQMRAGMWVRNGITLRHQMSTYRGVIQRDVSYQRDIFLLQVAFAILPPAPFLASVVDRFGITGWISGHYSVTPDFEDHQIVDVVEDFVHLLIIILSDRIYLLPVEDEPNPQILAMRRDLAHILCFKPLSFSDLTGRLADKVQDSNEFMEVLSDMTKFRPPEGLSDSGTFELKEEYIESIDPYIAHYSRNQREEAEGIYKTHMASKTGKQAADIVFEPKLRPIPSGVFKELSSFTQLPLFAQIIYYLLAYALSAKTSTPGIPITRVESYIHFVLQLILVAVLEDHSDSNQMFDGPSGSFVTNALTKRAAVDAPHQSNPTIISLLYAIRQHEAFSSCEPKIRVIMHRMQQQQPEAFAEALLRLNIAPDRMDTASPAIIASQEKELKKKQALERQERVMRQFKEQQSTFMANQAIDWGDEDFSDLEEDYSTPATEQEKTFEYPSGTCILCQEKTDDERLYGTFAFFTESRLLRQTDIADEDYIGEIIHTPTSLDRSAEAIRPFGVAAQNKKTVQKVTSDGKIIETIRQGLGKGFPPSQTRHGPATTGCGHIMHYSCFEAYVQATQRRHVNQIARNHPERPEAKEFLCPLCKALGNAFLPIIWKPKRIKHPGVLEPESDFDKWLTTEIVVQVSKQDKNPEGVVLETPASLARQQRLFYEYGTSHIIPELSSKLSDLTRTSTTTMTPVSVTRAQGPVYHIPTILPMPSDDMGILMTPESSAPNVHPSPMVELTKIYQRLKDTLLVNHLGSTRYNSPLNAPVLPDDLIFVDVLATSLGYSISTVEIAQRGVDSEGGATLLDKISSQSLTHLRVLSETVSSYIAIGGLRNQGGTARTNQEYISIQTSQLYQLFAGHHQLFEERPYEVKSPIPLLSQDAFIFLTECSTCIVPTLQFDIHHVMRLCYLAEITRVIVAYSFGVSDYAREWQRADSLAALSQEVAEEPIPHEQHASFWNFLNFIVSGTENEIAIRNPQSPFLSGDGQFLMRLVEKYALPFVRKAAILMNVRYGVEFLTTDYSTDTPELNRLSTILRLPSLHEIYLSVGKDDEGGHVLRGMMTSWIKNWCTWSVSSPRDKRISRPAISLGHPAIFELIGLPKNYDTLTDESIRRKCPTTGKDLTDPCLCLFCGDIFCSQGVCCMKEQSRGGCFQHRLKCGGPVGVFLNIRKCMVLFLHHSHGAWAFAPYLDKHGEPDPTLRRQHQLFLNQRRYDALQRQVWLGHGIPSLIARRLEGDVNNGGWETL